MNDPDFVMHERLLADTHVLGDYPRSRVLLHRNATIPWFMLVPRCNETEFLDLPEEFRSELLAEASRTGDFVRDHFGSSKINFAAIGNIVPQMHLHVVGRNPDDACWPAPVWGSSIEVNNFTQAELDDVIARMQEACGLR
jgi:diadenosine tetraphosphate (Ap4A) HIT family hydrolase